MASSEPENVLAFVAHSSSKVGKIKQIKAYGVSSGSFVTIERFMRYMLEWFITKVASAGLFMPLRKEGVSIMS